MIMKINERHNISVFVSIYNGEKYLLQQLDSINKQTRQADEVVLCDDGSSDNSQLIVNDFIKKNNLNSSWSLIINKNNLGVTRNFLSADEKTNGDIIFFSDQDDIWNKDKIKRIEEVFLEHKDAQAVTCRLKTIDELGNDNSSYYIKKNEGKNILRKISFTEQVKYNRCGGLCLALKKDFLILHKNHIIKEGLPHDLPFGMYAAANDHYYILELPLVSYRLHGSNISDPTFTMRSKINNYERHVEGRKLKYHLMNSCLNNPNINLKKKDYLNLKEMIVFEKKSINALIQKKFMPLIRIVMSNNPMINKTIALFNILIVLRNK